MAKRFTDTEKWKKSFIRSLPPNYKLLWLYITDECNSAGIWEVDMQVAEIKLGIKLKKSEAERLLVSKIVPIDNNSKWFIPSFIEFQYGELRDNNKPHISIIKILERYGLSDLINVGYSTPINNNIKGLKRLKIFERDGYTCIYCTEKFEVNQLEPDHIIPLNKNGDNDIYNIVTSCKSCNRKKSDLDLGVFCEKFDLDKESVLERISISRGMHTPWSTPSGTSKDKDKDKDKECGLTLIFNSEIFKKTWVSWKEYKALEHRFNFKTEKSEQASLDNLKQLCKEDEATAISIIQQSIANGWKGFFTLNNPPPNTHTTTPLRYKTPEQIIAERLTK